ncbi:bifunctional indole-3-glycerol-phosphate synthase TrpC/phosphoribosylanthranilate isomerase TrpF [Teredinibacter waterburyi]|uniref:bifunctional indole-3-glycerol-phosphate synthase TrpC/phosphoribosylanthranilate isomerase TrpF n=1 Tax=Teredinibacter waterburyi TaxID=1500538 RepID=UPI00165F336D|nr:bifunctional indole-3-glycerol-phosphate synthase TrpC/phosphoribosylanthranilate isomerase TrpF [Teredinibacter waterburyi]
MTSSILDTICSHRREDISRLKNRFPLSEFHDLLEPSNRSLYQALARPGNNFILECKKASPSKGLIRQDFNLEQIVKTYAPHAAAISVLTEPRYFEGSFDHLMYVRGQVKQPVLNKDFIVDPYQVFLARYCEADAILLMLSVLNDKEYGECVTIAEQLGLDVLTEVSNIDEVLRANQLGAKIVGINNRNLRDLSTDLATTEQLAPSIHKDALIISESGIYTRADVERLATRVNGFLVGSSLMAAENLHDAVKKLIRPALAVCN